MYSNDLENWMGNLSRELKSIPIIHLAIPGSHDSMSYGIDNASKPAPDAEKQMIPIYYIFPCVVRKWARTQSLTTAQQLKVGIRFFDLRVAKRERLGNYYFVHGLYCEAVQEPFQELRQFLDDHPKEFVILDCQHFYNFNSDDHEAYSMLLLRYFGDKLYQKKEGSLSHCTLDKAHGKQVIIVYRENSRMLNQFWDSYDWPTPWPNKVCIPELKSFLSQALIKRSSRQGFVSQILLTPDARYITLRFISSLKSRCAKKVINQMPDWIEEQVPGPFYEGQKPTCNVFIADFVELQDNRFIKLVVNLNHKIEQLKLQNV